VENLKSEGGGALPLFDAIVASEVIEHVENPALFLETTTGLLKEGGSLFITTINRTSRWGYHFTERRGMGILFILITLGRGLTIQYQYSPSPLPRRGGGVSGSIHPYLIGGI
jgi:SAM-dependent methyltransferase